MLVPPPWHGGEAGGRFFKLGWYGTPGIIIDIQNDLYVSYYDQTLLKNNNV